MVMVMTRWWWWWWCDVDDGNDDDGDDDDGDGDDGDDDGDDNDGDDDDNVDYNGRNGNGNAQEYFTVWHEWAVWNGFQGFMTSSEVPSHSSGHDINF